MILPALRRLRSDRRLRIILWALLIGAICGAIDFGEPAEDGLRAVRNELTLRPADQTVTVVAIDDRTLNALQADSPPRSGDARVIDMLFASGAGRIFFDRVYADASSPAEDAALRAAFLRHRGRVFIGAVPSADPADAKHESIFPIPTLRDAATLRSLRGYEGPFGMSAHFPIASPTKSGAMPSLSAELARVRHLSGDTYAPDLSIDYRTIPSVSYLDIARGRVSPSLIRGRDIIFGPTSELDHDFHQIPFRGHVPGVYFQVIGAQTLREGAPTNLGWAPGLLLAALTLAVSNFRRKAGRQRGVLACAAALLALPFVLKPLTIDLMTVPALLTLAIAGIRLELFRRRQTNPWSGLPTIDSLRSPALAPGSQIFAMRIQNYAAIKASSGREAEREMAAELVRRIGLSDEFSVIAHDQDTFVWARKAVGIEELREHVHGLHSIMTTGLNLSGTAVDIAVSFGVDVNDNDPLSARIGSAVQCAQDAAQAATIVRISERTTSDERSWRVQIVTQLEQAIGNGELWVAYQPKVCLRTGHPTGAEALVRWNHPTRGAIEPDAFIPVAEHHNRVEALTGFVLDDALATIALASKVQPDFKIAVNLSTQMLRSTAILDMIRSGLVKHRVLPKQLIVEVTETAPIEADLVALEILGQLKLLGVQISIDDFGTGSATLEYLLKIPANEVKIDKLFVSNLTAQTVGEPLAQSVIRMAHSLGRTVVAEGVETAEVAAALRAMGCDEAQGYHFDRAMPRDALLARIRSWEVAA